MKGGHDHLNRVSARHPRLLTVRVGVDPVARCDRARELRNVRSWRPRAEGLATLGITAMPRS